MVSLDRLGRSLEDLIGIVARLKREGVGFQSLHEKLDTTTPGGMFVFHVFAALAEFIRTTIMVNANEGLAGARARDQRRGRPPAMTLRRSPTPGSCSPSPIARFARSPPGRRIP